VSAQHFTSAVTASADCVALQFLALAGQPLTAQQRTQLEQILAKFFLRTGSFPKQ
jgi:hypothetical protein